MGNKNADLYRKLIALLLAAGGGVGVIIALWSEVTMVLHAESEGARAVSAIFMGIFTLIFGLSAWVGVDLWRKKPKAFTWARVLLIAQIPSVSFPGFAYKFYTGMTLVLGLNQTTLGFEAQLGSAISFRIASDIEGFAFGVNVVAALALVLLEKARASMESQAVLAAGESHY